MSVLALFGHGAMSELSALSRAKRKLGFEAASSAFACLAANGQRFLNGFCDHVSMQLYLRGGPLGGNLSSRRNRRGAT